MGKSLELDLNEPPVEYGCAISVMLEKDHKPICRAKCPYLPCEVPSLWTICEIRPLAKYGRLEYPSCCLYPEPENSHQTKEWGTFLNFLRKYNMAALVKSESCDFYICASDGEKGFDHAVLLYRIKKHNVQDQEPRRSGASKRDASRTSASAQGGSKLPINLVKEAYDSRLPVRNSTELVDGNKVHYSAHICEAT